MIGRSRSSGSCTEVRIEGSIPEGSKGGVEVLEAFGIVVQALEGQLWSPVVVLTANKSNHWCAHGQRDGWNEARSLEPATTNEARRTTCADSCANLRSIGSTTLQLVRQ